MNSFDPSFKTRRILNFFLIGLAAIGLRVLLLTTVQHNALKQEAEKPQRRQVTERALRGEITDRFGIPMAINATDYSCAIVYADIRQIPRVIWKKEGRKKEKVFARKEHIEKLAAFLSQELSIDKKILEDTIHAKASLFPHTPCVIKEALSEKQYYALKAREKDWRGLSLQRGAKRIYPLGKVGCDVVGYMGAIAPEEYSRIAQELEDLSTYLKAHEMGEPIPLPIGFSSVDEVKERFSHVQELSYTIRDLVGKAGVEKQFDEELRGKHGHKIYEVDINGVIVGCLDTQTKDSLPSDGVTLSISAKLQEEAEKLLAEYEELQDMRDREGGKERRVPWIRGASICAMDPNTGEVLALASSPRFDPNDFTPALTQQGRGEKRDDLIRWLENEAYIGQIWDGKRPLTKENWSGGKWGEKTLWLDWTSYLDMVLAPSSKIKRTLDRIQTVQQAVDALQNGPIEEIPNQKDQTLFSDLLHLCVGGNWPDQIPEAIGELPLSTFRFFEQLVARATSSIKAEERERFKQTTFSKWREEHFPAFLKKMRLAEKSQGRYTRPYTDYLEKKESELFETHWANVRTKRLYTHFLHEEENNPLGNFLETLGEEQRYLLLSHLRTFEELNQPLMGHYRQLRSLGNQQCERHLAAGFYPYTGFGFGRSFAYRQATPMGSIFKLIPSYAGLKHQYLNDADSLNPLTIVDDMQWVAKKGSGGQVLGYFEDGEPIKRQYKGGILPRAYPKIGKLNLIRALERSSNLYFSLLASEVLDHPSQLTQAATDFGLGQKTGLSLPGEFAGQLPNDILHNKTGLYSFAIGQHSLIATPLQTACMISTIANGGDLLEPSIIKTDTPTVQRTLFFPEPMREYLLQGMQQVVNGERGSARLGVIRSKFHDPKAITAYKTHRSHIVGKTGTAEIMYKVTLDAESAARLEKHVWFGGISFEDEKLENPELVVVVYFRFGTAGKQGAPLVAALTEKWREIRQSN